MLVHFRLSSLVVVAAFGYCVINHRRLERRELDCSHGISGLRWIRNFRPPGSLLFLFSLRAAYMLIAWLTLVLTEYDSWAIRQRYRWCSNSFTTSVWFLLFFQDSWGFPEFPVLLRTWYRYGLHIQVLKFDSYYGETQFYSTDTFDFRTCHSRGFLCCNIIWTGVYTVRLGQTFKSLFNLRDLKFR